MAKQRGRRIFGFLVRRLEPSDSYNRKLWERVYERAREREADLLVVAGDVLDDPESFDRAHAAVFRLLDRGLVDGALVSTTVTYRLGHERLQLLDKELGRLPAMGMSVGLGKRPRIDVDNEPGLIALMRHLIEVHGYRRIIHVRGPYPNEEAARREALWRTELERAGIEPRPEWLVPGGFDPSELRGIGKRILDQVGAEFDAVLACNDVAAHLVIADFEKLGYRVPQDYAVCGFDDLDRSRYSKPPLTTVHQPLQELARVAWNGLEELLERRKPRNESVPTTLVVRASCGCPPGDPETPDSDETRNLINRYERAMETFQATVYDLHNFIRAMNRVTEAEQLTPVLYEWLPRLGVPRFAVLRTSTATGEPSEHLCRWTDDLLPTAPPHFAVLTAWPPMDAHVIPGDKFSLSSWLKHLSPFVIGLFPLVTGDTWHGLAALELSRSAGLLELTLQEQLASALARVAHETRFRETQTLRQYAAEVAQEITLPLAAVSSAHAVIDSKLSRLAEQWMPFVTSLSADGLDLLLALYTGLSESPEKYAEEARARAGSLEFERVAAFLAPIADLPSATLMLGTAAGQLARYVDELRRSLLK